MLVPQHFKGRNVAVVGLARSGVAAARALEKGGARVRAWDDSPARRQAAYQAGIGVVDLYRQNWRDIAALVLSPGIPLTHPAPHPLVTLANDNQVPVIGDIELFARALGERPRTAIVAVTGTNGKSTTASLIAHVLGESGHAVALGGNIGAPALDLPALAAGGVYVLEMSSYQIDLTENLNPQIAILLNLAPDHLDRHGGMAGYVAAKERLFGLQRGPHSLAIIGIDDAQSRALYERLRQKTGLRVLPVTTAQPQEAAVAVVDGVVYDGSDGPPRQCGDIGAIETLRGRHNAQNAAAAFAATRALGVSATDIIAAFASFPGLAHRLEIVGQIGAVRFVNDSKATNAEATANALAAFDNIYWIAGGRPKADGIATLAPLFERLRRAYLIGEAASLFSPTLDGKVPYRIAGDLASAVEQAAADAAADGGGTVLLSPACASFDQFSDFEARGEAFRRRVAAMMDKNRATGRLDGAA